MGRGGGQSILMDSQLALLQPSPPTLLQGPPRPPHQCLSGVREVGISAQPGSGTKNMVNMPGPACTPCTPRPRGGPAMLLQLSQKQPMQETQAHMGLWAHHWPELDPVPEPGSQVHAGRGVGHEMTKRARNQTWPTSRLSASQNPGPRLHHCTWGAESRCSPDLAMPRKDGVAARMGEGNRTVLRPWDGEDWQVGEWEGSQPSFPVF